MRNIWMKCVYILILQFFLVSVALSNTLTVDEAGNVLAETDRYVARFENGVLMHFHNKLTNETYTQGDILGNTQIKAGRGFGTEEFVPEIKKGPSPLECELIYRDTWSVPHDNVVMLHLFIGIDAETGDLLIRQKGFSETGGIERIMWGFGNLSESVVDVIAPVTGGQILVNPDRYHYPRKWETPLVILQGQRGGVFVRSSDTQFRFKSLEYFTEGHSFFLNFWEAPFAPFEAVETITTATWRLNTYQGDWQVPALAYRKWMHEALQPADRSEMPAWVNDINVIIFHSNVDVDILAPLSRLVDPEQTLIFLHLWRHGGHDEDLPNYAPDAVKPEFANFVKEAHRYGFKIMAHVNMLGVSEYHPLYAAFEKYQVRDPHTGEKRGWYWEDRHTSLSSPAYINPASSDYRKMLVSTLKDLWERYQVDAFHLDISSPIFNDKNGLIDGLTYAEGNILLHQDIREAIPGILLGGEGLNDVTFIHESFAQRFRIPETEIPHPISSFLFSPYTKSYGRFILNPDHAPDEYQEFLHEYEVWDILLTIRIYEVGDLEPQDRPETFKLFELVKERQNYRFGDVNGDGIVNILDLTLVSQQIGTLNPSNRR
ncbi:hypothetical protein F4X90_09815, partial [Candidatus Poribacteria bacterium]|nr:hypothetical protein [Candidatus Poribacteria bacterium]